MCINRFLSLYHVYLSYYCLQRMINKTLKGRSNVNCSYSRGHERKFFICSFHPAGLADTIPVTQLPVIPQRNAHSAFPYSFPIPTINAQIFLFMSFSIQTGRRVDIKLKLSRSLQRFFYQTVSHLTENKLSF